jgi:hypothetical protein
MAWNPAASAQHWCTRRRAARLRSGNCRCDCGATQPAIQCGWRCHGQGAVVHMRFVAACAPSARVIALQIHIGFHLIEKPTQGASSIRTVSAVCGDECARCPRSCEGSWWGQELQPERDPGHRRTASTTPKRAACRAMTSRQAHHEFGKLEGGADHRSLDHKTRFDRATSTTRAIQADSSRQSGNSRAHNATSSALVLCGQSCSPCTTQQALASDANAVAEALPRVAKRLKACLRHFRTSIQAGCSEKANNFAGSDLLARCLYLDPQCRPGIGVLLYLTKGARLESSL